MNSSILKTIKDAHSRLDSDKNHRYRSWDHCYSYFTGPEANQENIDLCCLHLAVYLASWGMYRGSSFLLQKDYKIHANTVEILLEKKDLQQFDFSSIDDSGLQKIIDLSESIKKTYQDNIKPANKKRKTVNPTDTLVSKIMLGTLGCIPAYDRYCTNGMKKYGIKPLTLSVTNLRSVTNYYLEHKAGFDEARRFINEKSSVHYPTMKLVDMFFWEKGFES